MKRRTLISLFVFCILLLGLCVPQDFQMPVAGGTSRDYNPQTFWHYPWGKSVTHKGVDIFAKEGTVLHPAVGGWVVYTGWLGAGGHVVVVLGAKWRLHYYAHLQSVDASLFQWVHAETILGKVGRTGNAQNTPPHLHYSIITCIPYLWRIDGDRQGWKKMFYLNPVDFLKDVH